MDMKTNKIEKTIFYFSGALMGIIFAFSLFIPYALYLKNKLLSEIEFHATILSSNDFKSHKYKIYMLKLAEPANLKLEEETGLKQGMFLVYNYFYHSYISYDYFPLSPKEIAECYVKNYNERMKRLVNQDSEKIRIRPLGQ